VSLLQCNVSRVGK